MSLTTPYSEVYWSGNGVDKTFGFNFDAISENYVKCVVYFPEGYSVVPSFSANIALGELTINSITTPEGEILQIPPVGSTVRIFRDVPEVQNATTSQLQAFTAKQLEKTLDNVVAMIQENKYDVEHKTIRTTETERDVSLQALSEENDEELLMWSEEQHALVASGLTKEDWEQTSAYAVAVAEEARDIAEDAKGIAESADEKSDRALTNSLDAVGKAEQAITTAESAMDVSEQASEHADSALSLSQVAISKSNEAIATANTADIKATRAETKADRAVATSDRAEQKSEEALAGVQSAIEAAEEAVEAAERATTAAEAAEEAVRAYDGRIQEAQDNAAEALSQVGNKQDQLVSGVNIKTVNNQSVLGGGNIEIKGGVESVNTKTGVVVLTGEDIIAEVNTEADTVQGHLQTNSDEIDAVKEKLKEIELSKFPNATIIGEPTIQQGQVSDFSTMSYLQFPFILDLHEKAFQIDMCFTTATNVQTQQNILDSRFGIALAIQNGKGVMAISSNGTSWNIGVATGTMTLQSNTTYYARLTWDRLQYKTFLSTDGVNYTQDMVLVGAIRPFPTTIYIGGCDQVETGHTPHPFLGTINLNKASLTVMGNIIWQGMDDAGLATRADISLDNLDAAGQAKFDAKQNKLIAGENITIDETTNTISATGGADGESIKNQNASSSIEKTYNWTGTLQEAKDQNVRALHPDWQICITDDIEGGESVYTKSEVDAALNEKADKATTLSGYGIANAYTKTEVDEKFIATDRITNCITEIPQDIKLELNNGLLTLKAGSKVYVPNGPGVFDAVTTTSDLGHPAVTGNRTIIVYKMAGSSGLNYQAVGTMSSGSTDSLAGTPWHIWYDTTNNIIKRYGDDGVTPSTGHSLPIAIVTVSNGVITSIDQVFNGFGYIGSTVFTLPGVKGLIPNGRNEDGSLKNIEVTTQNISTKTIPSNTGWHYLEIYEQGTGGDFATNFYADNKLPSGASAYSRFYNIAENQMYVYTGSGAPIKVKSLVPAFRIEHSTTSPFAITSMKQITAFHALDYNDTEYIAHQAMPSDRYIDLTLGASGTTYTAPADGYVAIRQYFASENSSNFVGIYSASPAGIDIMQSRPAQSDVATNMPIKKGRQFRIYYHNIVSNTSSYFRFVYAEGVS